MQVVYAQTALPAIWTQSIFLAGPTPRDGAPSWRVDAVEVLKTLGYNGHVLYPEADGQWNGDYIAQVEWEERALKVADIIAFWVPRDPGGYRTGREMSGFTTNIEWGVWMTSGKVVWGAPEWARNVRYPEYYAKKLGVPMATTLKCTLQNALDLLKKRQHMFDIYW